MTTMTTTATVTETLVCANCSQAWEREVTRGRKPRYCTSCTLLPRRRDKVSTITEVKRMDVDSQETTTRKRHKDFGTLMTVARARIPALLVGPAGSGKSTAARQVAEELGLEFYTESCNPQMSKWDLMGFVAATGVYTPGILRNAFENGGVVLLDEIDASNPAVLVSINLIASVSVGETVNFPDGVAVARHADFVFLAGANTFGDGASDEYVGREVLDAASVDRFAAIAWGYDEALEIFAAGEDAREWTLHVQAIRAAAEAIGADLMVTPRAAINGAALLRNGMSKRQVEALVIWKGASDDTIRSVRAQVRNSQAA